MRIYAVFIALFGFMSIHGQTLSWSVDTNRLKIGERAEITIRLANAPGFELQQFMDSIGPLEIVEAQELDTLSLDPLVLEQQYTTTSFDTGYIALQPVIATSDSDTLRSEGLFFEIRNPEEIPEDIQPIHPPENAPKTLLEWLKDLLLYALLPAAVLFGLYRLWMRHKKGKEVGSTAKAAPGVSPEEWLQKAFAERRATAFFTLEDSKHFYDETTDLIRGYLFRRHEIHAMEMVTSELLSTLRDRRLYVEDQELLRELLQLADMAKFAKGTRPVEIHRLDFDRMETMVLKWTQTERDE